MAVEESFRNIAFPAVHFVVEDGLPLDFLFDIVDGYRGFVPPWRWPTENRLQKGGIFDSNGVFHDCDGEVGYRPPPPVIVPLANGFALGGALFVALHGNGSYGPRIVERRRLPMEEYRSKLRDVIFLLDETSGRHEDYVGIADKKLSLSRDFQQMVEVVRWYILTNDGEVEFAPDSKYYGRTPTA